MRFLNTVAIVVALTVLAVAAGAPQPIIDSTYGFSVTPVEGWARMKPDDRMPYVRLKLQSIQFPGNPDAEGLFYVDIFEGKDANLDTWIKKMRQFVNTEMKGKVLVDDKVTINGYAAHKLMYTGVAKGYTERDDGYFRLAIMVDTQLYVVHGVATQENFDQHWEDIRTMAGTFKLLKSKEGAVQ